MECGGEGGEARCHLLYPCILWSGVADRIALGPLGDEHCSDRRLAPEPSRQKGFPEANEGAEHKKAGVTSGAGAARRLHLGGAPQDVRGDVFARVGVFVAGCCAPRDIESLSVIASASALPRSFHSVVGRWVQPWSSDLDHTRLQLGIKLQFMHHASRAHRLHRLHRPDPHTEPIPMPIVPSLTEILSTPQTQSSFPYNRRSLRTSSCGFHGVPRSSPWRATPRQAHQRGTSSASSCPR